MVLKYDAMLKRLIDIQSFPEKEREHILYTLDALIKNVTLKLKTMKKRRLLARPSNSYSIFY